MGSKKKSGGSGAKKAGGGGGGKKAGGGSKASGGVVKAGGLAKELRAGPVERFRDGVPGMDVDGDVTGGAGVSQGVHGVPGGGAGRGAGRGVAVRKCPAGHVLVGVKAEELVGKGGRLLLECDRCDKSLSGAALGCKGCDYHICVGCLTPLRAVVKGDLDAMVPVPPPQLVDSTCLSTPATSTSSTSATSTPASSSSSSSSPPSSMITPATPAPSAASAAAPSPAISSPPPGVHVSSPAPVPAAPAHVNASPSVAQVSSSAPVSSPASPKAPASTSASTPAAETAPEPKPTELPLPIKELWDSPVVVVRDVSDARSVNETRAVLVTPDPERVCALFHDNVPCSFVVLSPKPFSGSKKVSVLVTLHGREVVAQLHYHNLVNPSIPLPVYAPPTTTVNTDAVLYVRLRAASSEAALSSARSLLSDLKLPHRSFFLGPGHRVDTPAWDYDVGVRIPAKDVKSALRRSGDGFLVRCPSHSGDYMFVPLPPSCTLKQAYDLSCRSGDLSLGVMRHKGWALRCLPQFVEALTRFVAECAPTPSPCYQYIVTGLADHTTRAAFDVFMEEMGVKARWIGREYRVFGGVRQLVAFVRAETCPKKRMGVLGNRLLRVHSASDYPELKPSTNAKRKVPVSVPVPSPAPAAAHPQTAKTTEPIVPRGQVNKEGTYLAALAKQQNSKKNSNSKKSTPPQQQQQQKQRPTTGAVADGADSENALLKETLATLKQQCELQTAVIASLQSLVRSLQEDVRSLTERLTHSLSAGAPTVPVTSAHYTPGQLVPQYIQQVHQAPVAGSFPETYSHIPYGTSQH